jgi:uncharacterized membrane protein
MNARLVQDVLVAAIVITAALYLTRRAWMRVSAARHPQSGPCGPDCGCGKSG